MQRVQLDNVQLEYDDVGSGDPLLLIHGSFIDTFFPKPAELRIASSYRVIWYHRRGYSGSSCATAPFTIGDHAADAQALLGHLGIRRAHVAGHSYGGAIAVQLALDAPDLVASVALLEPALVSSVPSAPKFLEMLASIQSIYERGDRDEASAAFMAAVLGPDYRQLLDRVLPPGAFQEAVAASDIVFGVESPALLQWHFTADDAARIRQPVLSVLGEESIPTFHEVHSLLKQWIPHSEELVVPQANHALPYMNPRAVADGLARFLDRHHL